MRRFQCFSVLLHTGLMVKAAGSLFSREKLLLHVLQATRMTTAITPWLVPASSPLAARRGELREWCMVLVRLQHVAFQLAWLALPPPPMETESCDVLRSGVTDMVSGCRR
jgi:hypothetical protein